jgi:hypothetical protein
MYRNYLVGGLMIAGTITLISAGGAKAEAQPMAGVNCRTVEGVKEAWGWLDKNREATLNDLQEHITKADDCVFDHYIGDIKEKVGDVMGLDELHDIFHVQKLSVCPMPGVCMMQEPQDRFVSRKAEATQEAPKSLYRPSEGDTNVRPL